MNESVSDESQVFVNMSVILNQIKILGASTETFVSRIKQIHSDLVSGTIWWKKRERGKKSSKYSAILLKHLMKPPYECFFLHTHTKFVNARLIDLESDWCFCTAVNICWRDLSSSYDTWSILSDISSKLTALHQDPSKQRSCLWNCGHLWTFSEQKDICLLSDRSIDSLMGYWTNVDCFWNAPSRLRTSVMNPVQV